MPCKHAEQPLSCSVLEDTHVHAPIEIMMAESTGGYLFICLWPTEAVLRTRGSSRAALRQKVRAGAQVTGGGPGGTPSREAEPRGHVAASELPPVERQESLS
jgi:hypothetical protein